MWLQQPLVQPERTLHSLSLDSNEKIVQQRAGHGAAMLYTAALLPHTQLNQWPIHKADCIKVTGHNGTVYMILIIINLENIRLTV
jgi:hypothetical protein